MKAYEPDIELVLFRGFGGRRSLCVAGRIVRRPHRPQPRDGSGWRGRMREAWRLLISRRLPPTDIELRCGDQVWRTRSDRHGYFFSCRAVSVASMSGLWTRYQARPVVPGVTSSPVSIGLVLYAAAQADQLVISDIDDTVVHTGVTSKMKMLWRMYAQRGADRIPFPGMVDFLRGLYNGRSGHACNPLIYVSRSPWSLYPILDEFFNRHAIPVGPVLLLRDWGITLRHPFPRRAEAHKAAMIERVLDSIPDLPVILIGDSGQRDPETYAAVAERYGRRIRAIYIRDLQNSRKRSRQLATLAAQLEERGINLFVAADADSMAAHAGARGWTPSVRRARPGADIETRAKTRR